MCSNRCANPVRPGTSFAGPTWYHRFTATIGTLWSSERMTSSPFCSLYLSNLSCGTSSGAGLGAAFCVCAVAGDFFALCVPACGGAGFCPAEANAKTSNAAAPSIKTFLSCGFINVSFRNGYRSTFYGWTTLAGVPKNLHLAYLGSHGVQVLCRTRYFDG